METSTLLAFLGVVMLAYVTPGPDWFVVLRRTVDSRRAGLVAMCGVQTGLMVHMAFAAVGVSAVLLTSARAFTALKLVGAAYLIYLGVSALRSARRRWRESPRPASTTREAVDPASPRSIFVQSFLANVLNPKAALFFVAVLPQCVQTEAGVAVQVITLGVIDVLLGVAWWSLFVVGVARMRHVVDSRRGRTAIDAVSGVALTAMGATLAATTRRAA